MSPRLAAGERQRPERADSIRTCGGAPLGRLLSRQSQKKKKDPALSGRGRERLPAPYIEGGDLGWSPETCFISLKLEELDEGDDPPPEGIFGFFIIR